MQSCTMIFVLLSVYCCVLETTGAERHTLQYLYTLHSAPEDDLEFEITTVFDGLIISNCKKPSFRDQSRQDWVHQAFTAEEWKSRDIFCQSEYYLHKKLKKNIEDIINSTDGIIQRERSCSDLDSVVHMSDRLGVNGEDFLCLDPNTLQWASDSPLTRSLQSDWNQMKSMIPSLKDFELNLCKPFLKKLKMKKADYLKENLHPNVYIFGKPSYDGDTIYLRCYISHKYLPGVRVRLSLDGVIVDNVNISSPAPNMDGSIQIRLETKANTREPNRYHCVVDADYLHTFRGWDGQTLNRTPLSHKHGLFIQAWVPLILVLIILGSAWLAFMTYKCCFIFRNIEFTQTNINISNGIPLRILMQYVQTEEEFRKEADEDDLFHGPTRPRRHSQ